MILIETIFERRRETEGQGNRSFGDNNRFQLSSAHSQAHLDLVQPITTFPLDLFCIDEQLQKDRSDIHL